jgi:NADPH-dependent 2,4-dienoyl-CoA reductase/sulfur reductase-like enzyme
LIRRDLVIVGAGPAGMAAAVAAAECGVEPTLVDEQQQSGGQIYRRAPWSDAAPAQRDGLAGRHEAALRRAFDERAASIEHRPDSLVWGVFPGPRLAVSEARGWRMIEARALVLATGAHEYVPPFPGWTLPGVMSAGGAQLLAKTMQVRPGRRALVAGSGPLLLVVAENLWRAGVEVVGVVEAARARELARELPALARRPDLLAEGWRALGALRRAGIPLHRGHVIVGAEGDDGVRAAVFAPCDAAWRPDRSRLRRVEVDTLCVGYGFVPRAQLAQLAGCRMRFAAELGGWIPEVSDRLETSVPGVFAAGDGAGVAGAESAALEGRLAGLAAARRLGALDDDALGALRRPVERSLARLRRFRAALDRISCPRPGLVELPDASTLCCRCEEVTRADLDEGIRAGGTRLSALKAMTRLGMGPCQGRMCWAAAARYVAARTGRAVAEVGPLSVRPPIRPIDLAALAEAAPAGAVAGTPAVQPAGAAP